MSRYIFLLLTIHFISHSVDAASVDSLPSCIIELKNTYPRLKTEAYEYKGQHWWAIVNDSIIKVENNSDQMFYTKFYDSFCQLVCTWTRGGIAGLNRVTPDSIKKEKIIPLVSNQHKQQTILGLSDTLSKLAYRNNAAYIQAYDYEGKQIYLIPVQTLPAYELAQKGVATTDENYYDTEGKIVATFKRATSSVFFRAQQWQPVSFKPTLLIKTLKKWVRTNNGYTMLK